MYELLAGAIIIAIIVSLLSFYAADLQVSKKGERNRAGEAEEPKEGAAGAIGEAKGRPPTQWAPTLGLIPPNLPRSISDELDLPELEARLVRIGYAITYAKRIYINRIFRLRVRVKQGILNMLHTSGEVVARKTSLTFNHRFVKKDQAPAPDPALKVKIEFGEGDFQAVKTEQTEVVPPDQEVEFTFFLKPLKSEDLILVVTLSYSGIKAEPAKFVEVSTEYTGGNPGNSILKTTPGSIIEDVQELAKEMLTIEVKSFLNLNAQTLNIVVKGIAILLTIGFIILAIARGLTNDPLSAGILGITSIVNILGIPLGADLWKNLQNKKASEVNYQTKPV